MSERELIDLQIAIRTLEREATPKLGSELVNGADQYHRSHEAAAAVLRRLMSIEPAERDTLIRNAERLSALELLGFERRQALPNMSMGFRMEVGDHLQQVGAQLVVQVNPDRVSWPVRLVVDPACGDFFDIVDVETWNDVIFRGPASARMFPPAPPPDSGWPFENLRRPYAAVQPGVGIRVRAQVARTPAPPFSGIVFGSTVLPYAEDVF